jgi:AhpC/TSA antioxidant enzyme
LREFDQQHPGRRINVRFITIGSQQKAEEFCELQGAASLCIGDEDKRTYRAMGLENYNLFKLFTDPALKKRRAENKAAGFSQNWGATKLADGAQLPGAAIIDANGAIRWLHRGEHPGDLPPIGEMMKYAAMLGDGGI